MPGESADARGRLHDQIPYFMSLSDFFIGKPGPGSISEALAMKLPVIVERNSWTLPQERYNADWVLEKDVGIVVPKLSTNLRSRRPVARARDVYTNAIRCSSDTEPRRVRDPGYPAADPEWRHWLTTLRVPGVETVPEGSVLSCEPVVQAAYAAAPGRRLIRVAVCITLSVRAVSM